MTEQQGAPTGAPAPELIEQIAATYHALGLLLDQVPGFYEAWEQRYAKEATRRRKAERKRGSEHQ